MSILARLLYLITPVWEPPTAQVTPSDDDVRKTHDARGTVPEIGALDGKRDVPRDPDHERDLLLMMHICC